MARRIDIELTSTRPDGTWTWRAAGAKQPKGVLDGSLLHPGAKTGDVLKAEAEFEIEGITIVSVAQPKAEAGRDPGTIEVVGPSRPETPGVTTQLVGRSDRRGPGRRRDSEQRPRGDRTGDGSRGPSRGPGVAGDRPERSERGARPPRQDGAPAERRERPDRTDRRGRGTRPDSQAPAPHGEGRPGGGADRRQPRSGSGRTSDRDGAQRADPRAKRLNPGHVHRHAILESLAPEQRAVAEQVLRGGIPAVRTALHLEREKAAAEGRPAPNTDQLIAMAEDLLPRLKAAEWRDRAEAAVKAADEISLRDLRSVVAGADVARDDETRALAATLREALDKRIGALRAQWIEEISKQLDEGRVVRALRLSSRPPEPASKLDDDLAKRLSDAAGQALSPESPADLWLAILDAAAASPVRRSIQPAGLPPETATDVRQAAVQQSGRIPALATMLGVSIPPPPVPVGRRPAPARKRPAPPAPRVEEAAESPAPDTQTRPEPATPERPAAPEQLSAEADGPVTPAGDGAS